MVLPDRRRLADGRVHVALLAAGEFIVGVLNLVRVTAAPVVLEDALHEVHVPESLLGGLGVKASRRRGAHPAVEDGGLELLGDVRLVVELPVQGVGGGLDVVPEVVDGLVRVGPVEVVLGVPELGRVVDEAEEGSKIACEKAVRGTSANTAEGETSDTYPSCDDSSSKPSSSSESDSSSFAASRSRNGFEYLSTILCLTLSFAFLGLLFDSERSSPSSLRAVAGLRRFRRLVLVAFCRWSGVSLRLSRDSRAFRRPWLIRADAREADLGVSVRTPSSNPVRMLVRLANGVSVRSSTCSLN